MNEKEAKIHSLALQRFDKCQNAAYEVRKGCLEDRRFCFITGAQWEGSIGEQFANKPKLEINKVQRSVIRIMDEYRNNRITVDFVSKDGSENDTLADACDGLFRADEQDSGAEEAYDNAFEEACTGGYGALRVISKYEDDYDDENDKQRICIEPIYDADSSVFFDIDSKKQDKSDSKYCFVMYSMTVEEFEEEYGMSPSSVEKQISDVEYDWYSPDLTYIAEYYVIEKVKETIRIFKTVTGDEEYYPSSDFEAQEDLEEHLASVGAQEVRQKKVDKQKVHKYLICGTEILEDCGYIAGVNIPVIPAYGKRLFVDNIERCMGHVRLAKDAQRLKNMLTSKLAEISALSTVEKPIFTPEQVVNHMDMWSRDNIEDYPFMLVDPITDANGQQMPAGPIGYTKPPQIPPALAALLQLVEVDMKDILGSPADAEKQISNISGKAQEFIQKRLDSHSLIYMTNFAKTIRRVGEVWLSMAKDVYVEDGRKMKTIGSMGETGSVEILRPVMGDAGKTEYENDITSATFDVAVDVGPSSSSQKEATVRSLTGMMQMTSNPDDIQILQAAAMMNMEGDGISEIREYFRKMLVQKGVVKPTDKEAEQMALAAQNQEPTPQDRALNAMADEAEAKAVKTRTEVIEVMSDAELNKAKTAETYAKIEMEKFDTMLKIMQEQQKKMVDIESSLSTMQPAQRPTGGLRGLFRRQ